MVFIHKQRELSMDDALNDGLDNETPCELCCLPLGEHLYIGALLPKTLSCPRPDLTTFSAIAPIETPAPPQIPPIAVQTPLPLRKIIIKGKQETEPCQTIAEYW